MTEEEMKAEIARLSGELSTLNENSSKLVKEKREALTRAEKAEQAAQDAAEQATSATSTELEKAIKRAEKAEKAVAAAEEQRLASEKRAQQERGEAALNRMIAGANVDSSHVGLLTKALRADLQYGDDGQPQLDGRSVDDWGKTYFSAKGDGYQYVRAANSGGGVARGSDGSRPAVMTKENFNLTEYGLLQVSDPEAAAAVKQQLGLSY